MRDYEKVTWETRYLSRNLTVLRDELLSLTDRTFAEEIWSSGQAPGPLNVCLSRAYSDTADDYQASRVVARYLAAVRSLAPERSPEEAVTSLRPLLRWDYGWDALASGLDVLAGSIPAQAQALGTLAPGEVAAHVEAAWRIGLWALSHDFGARCLNLDQLCAEWGRNAPGASLAAMVARAARECLDELAGSVAAPREASPLAQHGKLWETALVSARRHEWLPDGQPAAYRSLLAHVAQGGVWPPPVPANLEFQREWAARGCGGFWSHYPNMPFSAPFPHVVEFLRDPLEILNLGNAFDTCTRLTGLKEAWILPYAANATYRVAVARAADRRILGRAVSALCVDGDIGVRQHPVTYPEEECALTPPPGSSAVVMMRGSIHCFLSRFREAAGLACLPEGRIRDVWLPAYTKGWPP